MIEKQTVYNFYQDWWENEPTPVIIEVITQTVGEIKADIQVDIVEDVEEDDLIDC